MRIQLAGLPPGPQTFEHQCPAADYLDNVETFPGDISIRATILIEGNSLLLELQAEFQGRFRCDRCGQAFLREQRCGENFPFVFEETSAPSKERDVAVIPKGTIVLDISQEIRDLVLLGLPYRLLCKEDCLGLCPQCGADLNKQQCKCTRESADPRWEALQNLREKPTP